MAARVRRTPPSAYLLTACALWGGCLPPLRWARPAISNASSVVIPCATKNPPAPLFKGESRNLRPYSLPPRKRESRGAADDVRVHIQRCPNSQGKVGKQSRLTPSREQGIINETRFERSQHGKKQERKKAAPNADTATAKTARQTKETRNRQTPPTDKRSVGGIAL